MRYRAEIDGLRAISVLAVIFFHAGYTKLAGGFIGVDVFFVISGYLITSIVYDEVKSNRFTFKAFYARRAARILPALCITLLSLSIFAFIFYDNSTFDNFGKELFFTSLGAANILFSQGVNYFASEEGMRPLIHLWSLGVEEQFYLVWPILLRISAAFQRGYVFGGTLVLLSASLLFSSIFMTKETTHAYFLPQYRAFELLIGALIAIAFNERMAINGDYSKKTKEIISSFGLALILAPMFFFDKTTPFPGYNALIPCVGAALIIIFAKDTYVASILSNKSMVTIGLISYPLYLIHQPLISFARFFNAGTDGLAMAFLVTCVAVPISWMIYKFIEIPIRKSAHKHNNCWSPILITLSASMILFAISGYWIAKKHGLSWRFKTLNPFAYEVSVSHANTFIDEYSQGFHINYDKPTKILFIGDSALQQYIKPMRLALGVKHDEVDTVTRGGCVLLKDVDFEDKFADISCTDLRKSLYKLNRHYETIIISQSWESYDNNIKNANIEYTAANFTLEKWEKFIDDTIVHLKPLSDKIIIIGGHLKVKGTKNLSPTIFSTKNKYISDLSNLSIANFNTLEKSRHFFDKFNDGKNVFVIHPQDIWCAEDIANCMLHDDTWSFYRDGMHITRASTSYATDRLINITQKAHLKPIQ